MTSGRSSAGSRTVRNRGATPKCHHSCKTAEHKAKLQKYVPQGLRAMKTEACLSVCCPSRAVEVALRYVSWDLLRAGNSKFHSCWQTSGCTCGWLCGNLQWVSLAIIMPCYCSLLLMSPMPNECALHILFEGGPGSQLATLCRQFWHWHGCLDPQLPESLNHWPVMWRPL